MKVLLYHCGDTMLRLYALLIRVKPFVLWHFYKLPRIRFGAEKKLPFIEGIFSILGQPQAAAKRRKIDSRYQRTA